MIAKNVLVLTPEGKTDQFLNEFVGKNQWQFSACHTEKDAHKILSKSSFFSLIFYTSTLNNLSDFIEEVKKHQPKIPFIAIQEKEDSKQTKKILAWGAYACLNYSAKMNQLIFQLDRLQSDYPDYNPFSIHSEERTLVIPNDFSIVVHVVKSLVYNTLPSDEKKKHQIVMGLNEIVNNAIEHGNLGISFDEKNEALKNLQFFELAKMRAKKMPYKDRVVTLKALLTPSDGKVIYTVTDEGEGFDRSTLPNPKEEGILNRNGRGIMIAQYAFDKVSYNKKGNEVTLTYLKKNK